jgi:hypothetical protein
MMKRRRKERRRSIQFAQLEPRLLLTGISANDPNLVLWLDAADSSTLQLNGPNGANSVSTWTDKKHQVVFGQAIANSFVSGQTPQPVPQTSTMGLNSLPAVNFFRSYLGTPDIAGTNNPLDLTTAAHLFVVMNWHSSGGAASAFLNKGLGNSESNVNYIFSPDLNNNRGGAVFNNASWTTGTTNSIPNNTPVLFEFVFDSSLQSDNYKFFIDGVATGTRTDSRLWVPKEGYGVLLGGQGAADTAGAGVFVNDVFFNPNFANAFDGEIGEMALYDQALDSQLQDEIRDELMGKWLQVATQGVTIAESNGSTELTEGGDNDQYTVVLSSVPSANVEITVTPSDQATLGAGAGQPITLIFTPQNALTPQTVTVSAVDDGLIEGNHNSVITHVAVSADAAYDDIAIGDVTAAIADDDLPPPTVELVEFNTDQVDPDDLPSSAQPTSWAEQRSAIQSLEITFSHSVNIDHTKMVLTNLGVDAPNDADTNVTLSAGQLSVVDAVVTVQFPNSLPEGAYRMDILPTVTDNQGNQLDGDANGTGGDTYELEANLDNRFYVLLAEWSGDGGVSVFDFTTFSYWFGQAVPRAPSYVDTSGDQGVSVFDFTAFSDNFGTGISYPNALMAARNNDNAVRRVTEVFTDEVERIIETNDDAIVNWNPADTALRRRGLDGEILWRPLERQQDNAIGTIDQWWDEPLQREWFDL